MAIITNTTPPFVVGTDDADLIQYNAGFGFAWLEGLGGNDRYEISGLIWMNSVAIVEQAGGGIDTVVVDGYGNTFISLDGLGLDTNPNTLENLIFSGFESFGTIEGNALNNLIVDNGSANSTIDGGAGIDTMDGGDGNNTYWVDNSGDAVLEGFDGGFDAVISRANYVLSANIEELYLDGVGNLSGTGNLLDNNIFGNDGNNLLSGLGGDDDLNGNNGHDTLLGGEGNDNIEGGDGNDSLNGGTGRDILFGDDGNDILVGDAGNDDLVGGSGNDKLDGGLGNDFMLGGDGVDSLLAGAGDDSLDGGEDDGVADVLDGGAGNDRFFIGAGVIDTVIDGAGGDDVVFSESSYTMPVGIESLYLEGEAGSGTGNAGNNLIVGTDSDNLLQGMAGNDVLDGRLSDSGDILVGGLGNDRYIVNEAGDIVLEGAGVDVDTVFASLDFYVLPTNVEHLTIGNGELNAVAIGNSSNNLIISTGVNTDDELRGFDGNDTLDGGEGGEDSLFGGKGNDVYIINDLFDGGAQAIELFNEGTDTVRSFFDYELGNNIENGLLLGNEDAELIGNDLNNNLTGNSGDNFLWGRAGNDTMSGGAGDDQYRVESGDGAGPATAEDKIVEGLNGGNDSVFVALSLYTLEANVENLKFLTAGGTATGTGNALSNYLEGNIYTNTLEGLDGNDSIFGAASSDTLRGGNGNDTLDGGRSNDSMAGGAGNDLYIVDHVNDVVNEALLGGTDTVNSWVTFTLSAGVEHLTMFGNAANGTGNDLANNIWGTNLSNVLTGNGGDDRLTGLDGADTLVGGAGNDILDDAFGDDIDSMVGGDGNDVYQLDRPDDIVIEDATATSGSADLVMTFFSGEGYTLPTNVERLFLLGGEFTIFDATGNASANSISGNGFDNVLSGLDGNDTIVANPGNDTVSGGAGNDSLFGNIGDDSLDGGAGNDTMIGGVGNDLYAIDKFLGDVVTELANEGIDTVQLKDVFVAGTYTAPLNIENLELFGSEGAAINLVGNALNNLLDADDGSGGNNSLSGRLGHDTLLGGSGNDTLLGEAGSDSLNGGTGNDSMAGGADSDIYVVDAAGDVVTEAGGSGTDLVLIFAGASFNAFELGAGVENATVDSAGDAMALTGNASANFIQFNAQHAFTLNAGDGNDTVQGSDIVDPLEAIVLDGQGGTEDSLQLTLGEGTYDTLDVTGFENIRLFIPGIVAPAIWNLNTDATTEPDFSIFGAGDLTLTNLDLGSGFRFESYEGNVVLGFSNAGGGNDIARIRLVESNSIVLSADNVETLEIETEITSSELDVSSMAQTNTVSLSGPGSMAMTLGDAQILSLNGYSGAELTLIGDDSGGFVNDNTVKVDDSNTTIVLDGTNGFNSLTVNTTLSTAGSDITVEGPLNTLFVVGEFDDLLRLDIELTSAEGTPNVNASNFLGELIFTNEGIGLNFTAGDSDSDWLRLNGNVNETLNYAGFLGVEDMIEDDSRFDNDSLTATWNAGFEGALFITGIETITLTANGSEVLVDADFVQQIDGVPFTLNVLGNAVFTIENLHGDLNAAGRVGAVNAYAQRANGASDLSLVGGQAADDLQITGDFSSDTLKGGLGNDTLAGAGGQDSFFFDTALGATNVDTILDFQQSNDLIVFDHTIFGATIADGEGGGSGLTAAEFLASAGNGGVATTAAQRIIYDTSTGALYYDADGNGGGSTSTQFAELGDTAAGTGIPTITEFDFFIVP